jgi:predicted nucleic acid-binding Zn finger protein
VSTPTAFQSTTAAERRFAKARQILSGADAWTTVRADDGAAVYRIPSQSEPGLFYETDGRGCSCPDYLGRLETGRPGPCKHAIAVQLRTSRAADVRLGAYDDAHDPATCRLTICADC